MIDLSLSLVVFQVSVGAAERTRTFDLLINSQLHYRAVQRRQITATSATFSSTKLFKHNHTKTVNFKLRILLIGESSSAIM